VALVGADADAVGGVQQRGGRAQAGERGREGHGAQRRGLRQLPLEGLPAGGAHLDEVQHAVGGERRDLRHLGALEAAHAGQQRVRKVEADVGVAQVGGGAELLDGQHRGLLRVQPPHERAGGVERGVQAAGDLLVGPQGAARHRGGWEGEQRVAAGAHVHGGHLGAIVAVGDRDLHRQRGQLQVAGLELHRSKKNAERSTQKSSKLKALWTVMDGHALHHSMKSTY
jgi:hypothetical protein